jgi:N-terminal domain of oxidoreductase
VSGVNHQFRLAARPVGIPKRNDWNCTESPIPEPRDGEFVAKILYISLDPAMRGWMREGKSYIPPVAIGDVMRALALGRVIASKAASFSVGEYVYGPFGMQEYAASNGAGVSKVDPTLAPLPVFLGTLGMPGMTAYFGLLDAGAALSQRHSGLFRQRWRRDSGCGAYADYARRAHRHLRRDIAVQQYRTCPCAFELFVSAREPRQHDGDGGNRLRRPVCFSRARNGGLDGCRQVEIARAHCERL